jgi:hypothetical protein
MRTLCTLMLGLTLAGPAAAQEFLKSVPPRFDVLHNPDLYGQRTPKEALTSVIGAIERGRFDYVAAHLMVPLSIDARLAETREYFERVAAEQIAASGQSLSGKDLQDRLRDVGGRLNVRNLTAEMRRKFAEDRESLPDLKRMLRDATFEEAGETATGKVKDAPDRAVYFRLIDGRWFLDNRAEAAGKE